MTQAAEHSAAKRAGAFAIHILTASGVAFGLLALLAAHERRFTAMFLWLGIALFIDGIDGPLARRFNVKEVLPHWSGETLDLVVDYLNYVMVPAYALVLSGLIPVPLSYVAGAAIVVTGALYFADTRMKTGDAYFRGFPAVWNVVAFYLLIGKPPPEIALGVITVLCVLTFVPVSFLHPFRVKRLRFITLALLAAWTALAAVALAYDLSPPQAVWLALMVIAVYFLGAGILRTRI
ncbi:MAG: CDP-alcohol phosphatidyltransferase family protein [Xanthobacteraceae bacterium]|nr:CDP-alcohol phosphatidyltransferase family protein [Xanthobacteraceae bacterium]